jgi:hypothetical protein
MLMGKSVNCLRLQLNVIKLTIFQSSLRVIFNNNAIALMIKNCIEKLSDTKVLDTFSLKKAIAFFKENTRTDNNIP